VQCIETIALKLNSEEDCHRRILVESRFLRVLTTQTPVLDGYQFTIELGLSFAEYYTSYYIPEDLLIHFRPT
jgi:hypothetical protein